MTIKEALIAELDEISVSDATIDKVLLDNGLAGATTYVTATHEQLVDMAVIDSLGFVIGRYESVSEGGYSVKKSIDGLRFRIAGYYKKWGLVDPGAQLFEVEDISYLW